MPRSDYLIRKVFFGLATLVAVIVFNFFLFRILPGDPVPFGPQIIICDLIDGDRDLLGRKRPWYHRGYLLVRSERLGSLLCQDKSGKLRILNIQKGEPDQRLHEVEHLVPVQQPQPTEVIPHLCLGADNESGIKFEKEELSDDEIEKLKKDLLNDKNDLETRIKAASRLLLNLDNDYPDLDKDISIPDVYTGNKLQNVCLNFLYYYLIQSAEYEDIITDTFFRYFLIVNKEYYKDITNMGVLVSELDIDNLDILKQ